MTDINDSNYYLKKDKIDNNNDTFLYTTPQNKKDNYLVSYNCIFWNLIPNFSNTLLFFGVDMIMFHYVGQAKNIDLMDGLGLGRLFYGIAYFIGAGLTEGMAAECSKSFGIKNYSLLGAQANQTRIIIIIFSLIYAIINIFFSNAILSFLIGPDKEYLNIGLTYIYYSLPAIIIELQYEVYCKLSESQLNYKPVIISLVTTFLISPFLCYIFIKYLGWGIVGCVVVLSIIQVVKLLIMIYTYTFIIYDFSYDVMSKSLYCNNFWGLFKALFLSMVIFFADCAAGSISNGVSSTLGKIPYGKYIVMVNIAQLFYSVDYGFINSSCILVGNLIGNNSPELLVVLIRRLVFLSLVSAVPFIIIINLVPHAFVFFFSESEEIYLDIEMITLIIILSIGAVADIFQSNLQGILRGLGIMMPTIYSGLCSFFVFLPFLALFLTKYYNLGVKGVLIADLCSYFLNGIVLFSILIKTDYKDCCEEYLKQSYDHQYMSLETSPNTIG